MDHDHGLTVLGGSARNGGVSDDYGGGLRPATLYREICRVKYPDLSLSHLHAKEIRGGVEINSHLSPHYT